MNNRSTAGLLLLLAVALGVFAVITYAMIPTEDSSKALARVFIEGSSTYSYDGMDLEHSMTVPGSCVYCWVYTFEFNSRHAGYGDRSGLVLAQVITPHTAVINVENGLVTSAVLDNNWDMLKQEEIS